MQLVESPTHGNNILDIILTNDINSILNARVTAPFSTSDHSMVIADIVLPHHVCCSQHLLNSRSFTCYDFNRADWKSIRSYLASCNFNALFNSGLSASSIFDSFYNILYQCLDMFVPSRQAKSGGGRRKYPRNIRRLLSRKLVAYRIYRRSREPRHLEAFKTRAATCRTAINNYITDLENRLISSGNLGAFYRYANGKLSSRSTIGPLTCSDGRTLTFPSEKAELLNENFRNSFTVDNGIIPSNFSPSHLSKPYHNLSKWNVQLKCLKTR